MTAYSEIGQRVLDGIDWGRTGPWPPDAVIALGQWESETKRLKGLLAAIAVEAESLNVDLTGFLTKEDARVRVQNIHGLAVTPEVEAGVTQNVTSVEPEPDDPQNTGSKPDTYKKCNCGELACYPKF